MERYRILRKLAEGGSGETFLVWDKHLEQEWVMKCVRLHVKEEYRGERLEAAKQEVKVLRQLRMEGIPMLADAFYEEGTMCLIMEYMQGISLEEKIKRDGAMEEQEAVFYGLQLVRLLKQMHNLKGGLIHGDIKPLNIIWNAGKLALLDFGAAVFQYEAEKRECGSYYTPGYGAPELLAGGRICVASDVYAFGAVLFYMLTGKAVDNRCGSFVIREERPELSRAVEQIVLTCTQMVPELRYASMTEVECALRAVEKSGRRYRWQGIFERKGKKTGGRRKFQTVQNILLTDGKRIPFVLNCLEEDKYS